MIYDFQYGLDWWDNYRISVDCNCTVQNDEYWLLKMKGRETNGEVDVLL